MTKPTTTLKHRGNISSLAKIIGTGALLALPLCSQAFQLKFDDSGTQGFVDTTIALGGIWRTQDPVNGGASNLNFEQSGELVSTPFKITVEAGYSKNSMGAFVRANYIYDAKIQGLDTNVFNIGSEAQDEIGDNFTLLDAFVYGNFAIGNNMLSVRAGNQVLSWGESTFVGNSINSINPIDATKARGAAVEVKELIIPLPMVWASLDFEGEFSIDAYYVVQWTETIIDPVGTFFGTSGTDLVSTGAQPLPISATTTLVNGANDEPGDGGEFGFAYRTVIEDAGYMEVAAYFMRYHSHAPFLQVTAAAASSYQLVYPEDIDLYGASLNVDLPGELGLSLGAEISYRPDMPLSIGSSTFGLLALGGTQDGFLRGDMIQAQATFTYVGGSANPFGANKMTVLVEPGIVNVSKPDHAAFASNDSTAFGYVALLKLEYSNVFFDVNLEPSLTFKHDAKGTAPGGPFLENRKSLTAAVTATYLTSSTVDLGYTKNWGNEAANSAHDKDFFALTLKHSF